MYSQHPSAGGCQDLCGQPGASQVTSPDLGYIQRKILMPSWSSSWRMLAMKPRTKNATPTAVEPSTKRASGKMTMPSALIRMLLVKVSSMGNEFQKK